MPFDDSPRASRVIVVGVDGSPAAIQALRWAVAEAERTDAAVHAITVAQPDEPLLRPSFAFPSHGRRPVIRQSAAHERLRRSVAAVTTTVAITESVILGDPATELVKASATADLLVLGSHGRRLLAEVLRGSVTAECVRNAQCAVVTIPAGLAR